MAEKQKKKKVVDLLFITSCISTWLVLLLIAMVAMLLLGAGSLSRRLKQEMQVEIVLQEGLKDSQLSQLENTLRSKSYCADLEYISKADALKDMSAQMGTDPSIFLGYNPFYASIQMTLLPDYACTDSLQWISTQVKRMTGVSDIAWQQELMDNVNRNISKIAAVLLLLAMVLSLVSVALINNTIKLTIYAQRFTMYSMKLVGARWSFIRRPFIWKNALIGLISALMTCLTLWGGIKYAGTSEPWVQTFSQPGIMIPTMAVVTVVGLLITYLCALHSVNRFLRMRHGELYLA